MVEKTGNEEHQLWLAGKIVATARGILSGEIGIVDGAVKLAGISSHLKEGRDPDYIIFIKILTETDHLPTRETRHHWNPEVLKAKDAELHAYEAKVREQVFEACQRLIQKYDLAKS